MKLDEGLRIDGPVIPFGILLSTEAQNHGQEVRWLRVSPDPQLSFLAQIDHGLLARGRFKRFKHPPLLPVLFSQAIDVTPQSSCGAAITQGSQIVKHRLGVDHSVFGHRFDPRLDPVLVPANLPVTAFCLDETFADLLERKIPILAYRFPVHLESACHL